MTAARITSQADFPTDPPLAESRNTVIASTAISSEAVAIPLMTLDALMDTREIRMTNLFLQLGLPADEDAIARFFLDNQLPEEVPLAAAPIWNEGQRQFLREALKADDEWSLVVDALNESLHEDAVKARTAR